MSGADAADLFGRHHLAVFRFLRRLTGNAEQAEDLTQEVFLRVVRALPEYRAQNREEAWVFRIARNVLLDDRRRRGVRLPSSPGEVPDAPSRPSQAARMELDEALAAVPESEREAFLLREVGGLSYDEIAMASGATPDAVRSRIFRARSALRTLLAGGLEQARAPMRRKVLP